MNTSIRSAEAPRAVRKSLRGGSGVGSLVTARGNRLIANTTGGSTSSQALTFNPANQITNTGYTFDGTGNLTADPAGKYSYNSAEQMTKVTQGSKNYTCKYAGTTQTEVIQQQKSGTTYKLVYGRTNQVGLPVVEQAIIGSVTAYVENDPVTGDPLMLRTSTGTVGLYVYSGTGNPTALLRNIGGPAYTYEFDPYGLPTLTYTTAGTGVPQNPFLFKGGIQDRATGWVHYGNRWYNPTIGRWTQQDTLDTPLNPKNANRYAYSGCDPINNVDPTGRAASACARAIFGSVVSTAGLGFSVAGLVLGAPTVVGAAIASQGFVASATGLVYSVGSAINECS